MALRRSGLTKELRQGMLSTGLHHIVQVQIRVPSEPLSLKVPVLPRMLILISLCCVATPF